MKIALARKVYKIMEQVDDIEYFIGSLSGKEKAESAKQLKELKKELKEAL